MEIKENFGINISGYINKDFGLGVAVRSNINALKTAGVPFVINDVGFSIPSKIKDGNHHIENLSTHNPYSVNLIQINFDNLHNFFDEKGKKYFEGKYNIGFWAWELNTLPEEARVFFNLLDEIWVPSNYCAETISQYSSLPILKFMHSVSGQKTEYSRSDFNLPENKFVFLTMFDYHSTLERKNPIAVINAYETSFGKNHKDTLLIIKSSISAKFPKEKNKLLDRINSNKSIILIEEILETEKLYGLINSCNCFISLHRSEGFGLTMAEAMHFSKPVIATAYSANTEFMTINNSFLVKYELISAANSYVSSSEKSVWADPDISHAAETMKFVYENQEIAKKIGEIAKKDIEDCLNPLRIGKKMKERLHIINNEIIPSKQKSSENDIHILKYENQVLQKKIDALRKLSFVKMKESFKNFQNKISGKKRKYFWE